MVLLESNSLKYGESIKNFDLPDTAQKRNFSNANLNKDIAVVAFICNHCPYVVKIIKDFARLAQNMQEHVDFVAISANDPDYTEEDSPANMSRFAQEHGFCFPYLFDETQEVAQSFGAVCTPDIFTYKKTNGKYSLVYHARFEDLEKALEELKTQDQISFEQLPSAGCSIKWRS